MKTILLVDIDDTLLDFSWAESHAIRRAYAELGLPMTEEMYARYHLLNRSFWQAYERGELTRDALMRERHAAMFREYGLAADPAECERRYRKNLAVGYHLMPHALEMLRAAAPGRRLFAASNGVAETQYTRLDQAGLTPYFEKVLLSEDAGVCKPEKGFFDYCFAQIPDFAPEAAVLIGDSLSSDILGGKNAGIDTVWYNPGGLPAKEGLSPTWEIRDLLELPKLL